MCASVVLPVRRVLGRRPVYFYAALFVVILGLIRFFLQSPLLSYRA